MKYLYSSMVLTLFLVTPSFAGGSKCYPAPFDASNFTTDLFTTFPAWRTLGSDGFYSTNVIITSSPSQICVKWIDTVTIVQVDAVFSAHNRTPTAIYGSPPSIIKVFTLTFNPVAIPANSTDIQNGTVPGLLVGDVILISKPTYTTGCTILATLVTAPDTISVLWRNLSASSCDPPLETYKIMVVRP